MTRTIVIRVVGCVKCGPGGPPMAAGDSVRLNLNQENNEALETDLPEFIFGVVQAPVLDVEVVDPETAQGQPAALVDGTQYTIDYEDEDISGYVLEPCDILTMECVTCCDVVNNRIDEVIVSQTDYINSEVNRIFTRIDSDKSFDEQARESADALLGNRIDQETAARVAGDIEPMFTFAETFAGSGVVKFSYTPRSGGSPIEWFSRQRLPEENFHKYGVAKRDSGDAVSFQAVGQWDNLSFLDNDGDNLSNLEMDVNTFEIPEGHGGVYELVLNPRFTAAAEANNPLIEFGISVNDADPDNSQIIGVRLEDGNSVVANETLVVPLRLTPEDTVGVKVRNSAALQNALTIPGTLTLKKVASL